MSKAQQRRDAIRALKLDANEAKAVLFRIESKLRAISAKEANSLWRIIGRLESWQNR